MNQKTKDRYTMRKNLATGKKQYFPIVTDGANGENIAWNVPCDTAVLAEESAAKISAELKAERLANLAAQREAELEYTNEERENNLEAEAQVLGDLIDDPEE